MNDTNEKSQTAATSRVVDTQDHPPFTNPDAKAEANAPKQVAGPPWGEEALVPPSPSTPSSDPAGTQDLLTLTEACDRMRDEYGVNPTLATPAKVEAMLNGRSTARMYARKVGDVWHVP